MAKHPHANVMLKSSQRSGSLFFGRIQRRCNGPVFFFILLNMRQHPPVCPVIVFASSYKVDLITITLLSFIYRALFRILTDALRIFKIIIKSYTVKTF